MSVETNKQLIQSAFEAWNTGDTGRIRQITAPTFRGFAPTGEMTGIDGYVDYFEASHTAFPDLRVTVHQLVAEGDTVVARYTLTGTNTGPLLNVGTVTGKTATITGIALFNISEGAITGAWNTFDRYSMLQQLGVVPATRQLTSVG